MRGRQGTGTWERERERERERESGGERGYRTSAARASSLCARDAQQSAERLQVGDSSQPQTRTNACLFPAIIAVSPYQGEVVLSVSSPATAASLTHTEDRLCDGCWSGARRGKRADDEEQVSAADREVRYLLTGNAERGRKEPPLPLRD